MHEKLDYGVERVGVGEFFKGIGQVALDRTTAGVAVGSHEVDLFTGFFPGGVIRVCVSASGCDDFLNLRLSQASSCRLERVRIPKASHHKAGLECRFSCLRMICADFLTCRANATRFGVKPRWSSFPFRHLLVVMEADALKFESFEDVMSIERNGVLQGGERGLGFREEPVSKSFVAL